MIGPKNPNPDRLALLSDVLRSFADATTDYPRLVETIASRTATFLGHAISIRLLTDDGAALREVALCDPIEGPTTSLARFAKAQMKVDPRSALATALQSDRGSVMGSEIEGDITLAFDSDFRAAALLLDIREVIIAPMHARGQSLGALFIVRRGDHGTPFESSDVELAEGLASHAALAISNANALQQLTIEIEERRKAESSLATAARLANRALLLEYMSEAVIAGDLNFRIHEMNPAASRLFGFDVNEARGRLIEEVLVVIQGANRVENREKIKQGVAIRSRMRAQTRGGQWLDIDYSSVPVVDANGVATGFVSVMQDVTQRIRLEHENEHRLAELERANRELEGFSYSISHDLRAPIRAIQGFARIVKEDYGSSLDAEGIRLLDVITRNAHRMGRLIDDLLRFVRLGRQTIDAPRAVDMEQLVNEVLEHRVRDTTEDVHSLGIHVGAMPHAYGDRSLLFEVWGHLLDNAIKFSRTRSPRKIDVTSESHDGKATYVVRDNGVGFDMRYSDKLFGVFERLHPTSDFEGTGVGLALVERIIQRHGGRVWAESALDSGASFFFSLPNNPDKPE